MFRLLRYFSIASLLALLIVTVLLGFLYRRTTIQGLLTQEESKNVALTQAFVNSLRPQLNSYLTQTQGLSTGELRSHPDLAELRRAVMAEVGDLPIAKIKIYNIDGVTIFSTEESQIGNDQHLNDGFIAAHAGDVVSELTRSATFNAFDGVVEDQDVISTYFPVRAHEPEGAIEGVFELYSNVTPLLHRIDATQRAVVIGVALLLIILYAILFLAVRHADVIIRRQYEERFRAEQALQQQQRTLARLRERERLAWELHDSVGQVFGFLNIQAQTILGLWKQGQSQEAYRLLQRLLEVVQHAHVDLREQIQSLQNGATSKPDFSSELEKYLAEFRQECNIAVELIHAETWLDRGVDRETEAQLLRIVQEALTNVRKHAQAKHAWVLLDVSDEHAWVTVADDGKGFAIDQMPKIGGRHFGLQIMCNRAQEIGGRVEVHSAPGRGTRVSVKVPMPSARNGRAYYEGIVGG